MNIFMGGVPFAYLPVGDKRRVAKARVKGGAPPENESSGGDV